MEKARLITEETYRGQYRPPTNPHRASPALGDEQLIVAGCCRLQWSRDGRCFEKVRQKVASRRDLEPEAVMWVGTLVG